MRFFTLRIKIDVQEQKQCVYETKPALVNGFRTKKSELSARPKHLCSCGFGTVGSLVVRWQFLKRCKHTGKTESMYPVTEILWGFRTAPKGKSNTKVTELDSLWGVCCLCCSSPGGAGWGREGMGSGGWYCEQFWNSNIQFWGLWDRNNPPGKPWLIPCLQNRN